MIAWDLQKFAEKTERATPEKRLEARKRGQVAHSTDFSSAVSLLAIVGALAVFGGGVYQALMGVAEASLSNGILLAGRGESSVTVVPAAFLRVGLALAPVLGTALALSVLAAFLQVGPLFSFGTLLPDFSRIDPIKGFGRLFSLRSFVDLFKSIIKLTMVGVAVYMAVGSVETHVVTLTETDPTLIFALMVKRSFGILLDVGGMLLGMAVIDIFYQRFKFERSMRMSKEEVKDEQKRMEGNPAMKRKLRERGREIARQRMMQKVPEADVVVTNPTHYAVALAYDPAQMAAPQVVAKGINEVALRIRELATLHGVPLVENRDLARTLYGTVELDGFVPMALFQAVAEVLAYVYRLKGKAP